MWLSIVCFMVLIMPNFCLAKPVGKVSFHAKGEGLALDINGEGGVVDADLVRTGSKVSGTFNVALKDFKTGMTLRDEHFQKLMETPKYPIAKFTLTEMEAATGTANGTMELHGKTMPISWPAKFNGNKVSITGKVKMTDFGLVPPEYKLAKVANEVEISIDLAL